MRLWELVKRIFKKTDDLREKIEDSIAAALDKASESEILDKGQETVLNAAINAIEIYASGKTGQNIKIPNKTKESVVKGITNGNNRLQKKIAEILRK